MLRQILSGLANRLHHKVKAVYTLQFRYAINNRDALVMQFSNRRLGLSAIQATEPDVALDWAFFQTRWQDASIRIGRSPCPEVSSTRSAM